MTVLKIDGNEARQIYPTAPSNIKNLLEDVFGKTFFSENITESVKSFEDACQVLGMDVYDSVHSPNTPDVKAYKKLKVIVEALNEGWKPDWKNEFESKYFPCFHMTETDKFCFLEADSVRWAPTIGSRLCFRTEELATYAATQFIDLYKDLMVIESL